MAERTEAARGVYSISVTAELVGTGVQNLRLYERRGLVEPTRSDGGTRRYSQNDIDRLNRVIDLLAAGLNLAGIAMVLELQDDNAKLKEARLKEARLKEARLKRAGMPDEAAED